ncbi:hypothetical protein DDB_G0275163 [Dictyostelium discoideum AX4]|uniref:Uncharacterized protein n=1 Tax=Dictyostelium discoideum TaxID=44689 RepID=Q86I29_DICDI|nr:hypothetical protein DDB_G0275163 [Dictyostelium discoideum AX4]EAL69862.1 hypothetical protein DDB_G0275163 [Dictyostelium discoideum AX4]|eukprot:XP_643797.1 hypothetical protein DDB_G0275163 [Dictyostelium discoideum AX4]
MPLNINTKEELQQQSKPPKTNQNESGGSGLGLRELHKNPNVGNEQYFTSFQKYVHPSNGHEEIQREDFHTYHPDQDYKDKEPQGVKPKEVKSTPTTNNTNDNNFIHP